MNNKRGGFGAKVLLVIILMLASAAGGAYAYRYFDAKMAVKDATKEIQNVDVGDYDTQEAATVQDYIDDALKDLETATSREAVYDILKDFNKDVNRIQTKAEKEAAEALERAQNASKKSDDDEDTVKSKKAEDDDEDTKSTGLFNFKSDDE